MILIKIKVGFDLNGGGGNYMVEVFVFIRSWFGLFFRLGLGFFYLEKRLSQAGLRGPPHLK